MPSANLQHLELNLCFAFILHQISDILDDLFYMRLEIEAGEIPVFSPEPVFNPMKTIGKYQWSYSFRITIWYVHNFLWHFPILNIFTDRSFLLGERNSHLYSKYSVIEIYIYLYVWEPASVFQDKRDLIVPLDIMVEDAQQLMDHQPAYFT